MSETSINGEWGDLVIEREMIEVSSALPQPDPRWRFTDNHGHEHAMVDGAYPTLELVPDGEPYLEDGETYQPTKWVCRACGEDVTPGTFVDTSRRFMPGRWSATLNGQPVGRDEVNAILASVGGQPI